MWRSIKLHGSGNVLIGQGIEAASNTGDRQLIIAGNDDGSQLQLGLLEIVLLT